MTREEFWRVILLAYNTGHFGPPAYPDSNLAQQINADTFNLLHQYNGGPAGTVNYDDQDNLRPKVVAAIEDLFAGQLRVVVHPGYIDFSTRSGIGFEVK